MVCAMGVCKGITDRIRRRAPTPPCVRAALGDTGSKSTIATMLKQWKAQHHGEKAGPGAGLPADLPESCGWDLYFCM